MLLDSKYDDKFLTSPLEKTSIPIHWQQYILYTENEELYNFTKEALLEKIEIEKQKNDPHISSKILLADLLTEFGSKYQFHRLFNQSFPGFDSGAILGMQLYMLLLEDDMNWYYYKSKDPNHLYSSSNYFPVVKK